jgi:hypothetical protein
MKRNGMQGVTEVLAANASREHSNAARAIEHWFRGGLLAGDTSLTAGVFSPDVLIHSTSGEARGLDALNAVVVALGALEELEGELDLECEGERLSGTFAARGRQVRSLWGVSASQRLVEFRGTVSLRVESDKVVEIWTTSVTDYADAGRESGPRSPRPVLMS